MNNSSTYMEPMILIFDTTVDVPKSCVMQEMLGLNVMII